MIRLDCGTLDPFRSVSERYRSAVSPRPEGGLTHGCHTDGYWRGQGAAEVAFLGEHLGRM